MKRKTYNRNKKKSDARRAILWRVFKKFGKWECPFFGNEMPLEDMVAELAKHRGVIAAEYQWLIKSYKWEPDLRSGEETYGYESRESIRDNLFYISDRWIAQFRLRWVLDLIDRGIGD